MPWIFTLAINNEWGLCVNFIIKTQNEGKNVFTETEWDSNESTVS